MNAQKGWPKRRLDELTESARPITYGVVKPGDHDDLNGVRFIRGGDIAEGKINIANLRTITSEVSAGYKRTLLRGGEIVVSLVGNPGEAAVVPASLAGANIARQAGLVALRDDVDPRYVMYFLRSPGGRAELFAQTTGSVQQVINLANLKNIRVPLPDLSTQRKIAGILSAYDDLIENNLCRIKILEEMAQSLYREWFVHFRFPGHESAKFVDAPLGQIPKGWNVKPLFDVATVKYGKMLPKKDLAESGPFPVYGAAKVIGRHTSFTREDRTIICGCRGSVGEMQITEPRCFVTNNSFTFDPVSANIYFWLFYTLSERALSRTPKIGPGAKL
jgi:type I restriction enzyme S subunit